MEWSIEIDKENKYAEIITRGVADQNGSRAMVGAITETMMKNQITKIIMDHRQISDVSGEIPEVRSRPRQLQEMGAVPDIKVAEVVKPEHEPFFSFLKIVFVNRGFQFAVFYDKETAIEWLKKA